MIGRGRLAAIAVLTILACPAGAQDGGGARPPAAVTVQTLAAQDVTITATLPGRIVASGRAEVRPQVDGIVTDRLFTEGSEVEKGDPLYKIDDASYAALVAAASASVAQARANLDAAESEARRLQTLFDRKVASEQNVDDAKSDRDAKAAALQVAEAQLLAAQIDLDHTTIRAPLSGIVGRSLTTQGALVTRGQAAALAVIRSIDPVHVDVTQSAAEVIRARRGLGDAGLDEADQSVTLRLADGGTYDQIGLLTAAEPYVDELTGVVVLRLTFPNPEQLLLPGMYVQVEMPQYVARDVILAPQQGVTRDRRGRPVAMVVSADNTVEQRDLTILGDQGPHWIVTDGLADGDRIIVEGLQKIGVGMTVAPEEQAAPGETGN
ncbi:efflux RND transporter periplasmic adaptor subunit [Pukyongiella litopenaei]|uniref:Efflux RND transporter periplasmic adaptor subunit n=1 Tax=Pukyongiella litopenaei TaxID=2605946 RepID=A0A2S0MQL0_9RHOB|nr:efflux RND transporter periplasmic adaptor subunit [Pukyongiella litopenaei]AVO38126.1 efflux RND transporter periplasmic adaptor subunit [Pukyongiella litopenaei]